MIVDGDLLEDDADGIMDHIYIENCYIHDVDGPNDWNDTFTGGIIFNVIGSTIRPNTSFRDLRIANNTIRKVGHIRYFVRYMDDMCLWASSKKLLHRAVKAIEKLDRKSVV